MRTELSCRIRLSGQLCDDRSCAAGPLLRAAPSRLGRRRRHANDRGDGPRCGRLGGLSKDSGDLRAVRQARCLELCCDLVGGPLCHSSRGAFLQLLADDRRLPRPRPERPHMVKTVLPADRLWPALPVVLPVVAAAEEAPEHDDDPEFLGHAVACGMGHRGLLCLLFDRNRDTAALPVLLSPSRHGKPFARRNDQPDGERRPAYETDRRRDGGSNEPSARRLGGLPVPCPADGRAAVPSGEEGKNQLDRLQGRLIHLNVHIFF